MRNTPAISFFPQWLDALFACNATLKYPCHYHIQGKGEWRSGSEGSQSLLSTSYLPSFLHPTQIPFLYPSCTRSATYFSSQVPFCFSAFQINKSKLNKNCNQKKSWKSRLLCVRSSFSVS